MSMASYGRMLVEASLRKKRAIVSTQCQRLPSAKDFLHSGIDHNQKVKEWLVSCDKLEEKEPLNKDKPATEEKSVEDKPPHKGKQLDQEELPKDPEPPEVEVSDEREQPSDEDSGENEGVVQSSGSEYKPSECSDSEQKYDYVAASIASECSEIYPMLQNSGELPLADSELNVPGNDLMPLRSSSDILADATENQLTTPTPSQLKRAFANVTVAGDAKISGKRSYRKPDYCLFCKGMYMSKISAHYLSVHTKESKVKDIMDLPCGSKERKRLLSLLQNEGNHLHNCDGEGSKASNVDVTVTLDIQPALVFSAEKTADDSTMTSQSKASSESDKQLLVQLASEVALKWTLNCVSTGAHILLGKVYKNLMVDVKVSNIKLFHRAISIIQDTCGLDIVESRHYLLKSIYGSDNLSEQLMSAPVIDHVIAATPLKKVVPTAVLMGLTSCTVLQARSLLDRQSNLSQALRDQKK